MKAKEINQVINLFKIHDQYFYMKSTLVIYFYIYFCKVKPFYLLVYNP